MKIRPLAIDGVWEITPEQHPDPRGTFLEWFRFDRLGDAVGRRLRVAEANMSVSARDVVRGVHFADVPPGQAKYVTCVSGAIFDVAVDLRVGSPTFGVWEGVRLDDTRRAALYLAEGIGHAFCALTDDATVSYLCSEVYAPQREHGVHPLDPDLGIEWPTSAPRMSDRDTAAPTLAKAKDEGLLPDYRACLHWVESLGVGSRS